jgi:hypothetical protein
MRLIIGIGIGLSLGLWKGIEYRQFQEKCYQNSVVEMKTFQNQLKDLQDDQAFLKNHSTDLEFLSKKKFYRSENRLISGKCIEEVGKILSALQYTFAPERLLVLEGYTYKVTKIVIDTAALLDTEVYKFIEKLIKDFPGILHLSEVNLVLNAESPPPYIKGKLEFEWYTVGEKK